MLLPMKKGRGIVAWVHSAQLLDHRLLLLALLFLLGTACGALAAVRIGGEDASLAKGALRIYLQTHPTLSMQDRFMQTMLPNLALLGVVFFSGFCAVAEPILLFLPFFKGLGFGMITSFLLQQSGISAVKVIAISVFPVTLWSSALLLLACRDAGLLSSGIREASRRGGPVSTDRFCAMMLLYFLLLCIGCAVQAWSGVSLWSRYLPLA